MADFLDTFKRRESSEGSNIDDDEDEPHQFAREEINHQSDEEENRTNERRNQNNDRSKPYQGEENKDYRDQGQNRNAGSTNQAQNKKKDYYLYQGEEKPYESDQEEEGQGKGPKPKREAGNLKNKKKDPTYVPKGTFYQHDTRGDETEYVPKKSGGNQGKLKWRHDKFEKGGNKDNGYDKKEENPTFVNKQKEVVYYVVKGANEQKPAEEEPQQQQQQQQRQQQQRQQQPREDRPQQQSRGKGYDYDKGGYGNDRDRGYNQNSGKYREYPKKDNYKKSGGNTGGKQDVYYEYVPKKQV